MHKSYIFNYRIDVPPYDKLLEVLEAFYASYPGGDYSCEKRDRFKLVFRRGLWKKSLLGLGELVPERLVQGQFNKWPIVVRVLVRPSPTVFSITVHYGLHLPKSVPALIPEVRTSVDQHAQKELADLAAYLAECIGLERQPTIQPQE